jgi:hypothetical protein
MRRPVPAVGLDLPRGDKILIKIKNLPPATRSRVRPKKHAFAFTTFD